jgi:hypothetical protein
MTNASPAQGCRAHLWERRLEVHEGVQCVVRFCLNCRRKELCWSRRPLPPEAVIGGKAESTEEPLGVLPKTNVSR